MVGNEILLLLGDIIWCYGILVDGLVTAENVGTDIHWEYKNCYILT